MKKLWFILIFLSWIFPLTTLASNACLCYKNDGGCESITIDDVGACVSDCLDAEECIALCKSENCPSRCQSDFRENYSGRFDYVEGDADRENEILEACLTDEAEATAASGNESSGYSLGHSSETEIKTTPFIYPNLNVDIPTVSFSEIAQDNGYISVNFLGEYVSGLYKYLLGIAATFAIIMLMIGGIEYVISPEGKNVSKAKKRINKALTGMALLSCIYLILYVVNPNLVSFNGLEVKVIDQISYTYEEQSINDLLETEIGPTPTQKNLTIWKGVKIPTNLSSALTAAAASLEGTEYTMLVYDGFRTVSEQEATAKRNPGFACIVKGDTEEKKAASCPHTSGLAVDVWGISKEGTVTKSTCLTIINGKKDYKKCFNEPRQAAIIKAMKAQGFCVLNFEPWHFELRQKSPSCQ